MPVPLPAISAAVSIGSSLLGLGGSLKANKEAREAAKIQSQLTYESRLEEIRRARREQQQVMGFNRAAVGASNVQFSGSARRVLQDVQADFNRDINWRRNAAQKERESIRRNAPGAADNISAFSTAASSIGRSILNFDR